MQGRTSPCAIVIIGTLLFYPDKQVKIIRSLEEIREPGCYFFNIDPESRREPSFEYVKIGVEMALQKKIAALVTAPISKEKWLKAGIKYIGHTQYLAETADAPDCSMFFWSERLKVSLFTIHIPLREMFKHIEKTKIIHFIRTLDRQLQNLFKRKFNLLVSGLNPHAGEYGSQGDEEIKEIIPALETLEAGTGKESKIDITGPYPADTIFLKALEIKDSVVISWYHDQGLIPFKLLNIHSGVNITLGLPYIRTAPDHGTAYDIAGKNIADPGSMIAAIDLAEKLTRG